MDEYDVFLDDVSRRVTLEQLQKYALLPAQRGRQFIIVTPHNLADVRTSNDVRIQKMQPPQRRQTAHGLQQAVLPFGRGEN
jgi:chromosome segregation ATPase